MAHIDDVDPESSFFETVGSARAGSRGGPFGKSHPTVGIPASDAKPARVDAGASWASSGDTFWKVGKSHTAVPPGVYRCGLSPEIGPYLVRVKNDTDTLIMFPDSDSKQLVEEIQKFQTLKEKFTAHGFLHKRGILMWGPPGSGKTTTVQLLIRLIVNDHEGIACFIENPGVATSCFQMIRQIEPDRQIIGIMEDLDSLVESYGEAAFLALLDGESQVDNCVYVATTNYPEKLDRRFVDRPSRFDTVRYIGFPNWAAREVYFATKLPDADVVRFVEASEGYSVAHMRELVILTQCFGVSLEDAKKRLDKSRTKLPNSSRKPDAPQTGFGGIISS